MEELRLSVKISRSQLSLIINHLIFVNDTHAEIVAAAVQDLHKLTVTVPAEIHTVIPRHIAATADNTIIVKKVPVRIVAERHDSFRAVVVQINEVHCFLPDIIRSEDVIHLPEKLDRSPYAVAKSLQFFRCVHVKEGVTHKPPLDHPAHEICDRRSCVIIDFFLLAVGHGRYSVGQRKPAGPPSSPTPVRPKSSSMSSISAQKLRKI